jgi:hypothetical protein
MYWRKIKAPPKSLFLLKEPACGIVSAWEHTGREIESDQGVVFEK